MRTTLRNVVNSAHFRVTVQARAAGLKISPLLVKKELIDLSSYDINFCDDDDHDNDKSFTLTIKMTINDNYLWELSVSPTEFV